MSCNLTFYFLSRKRNCEYSTLQHRVKKKLGMKCFNYEDNVDVATFEVTELSFCHFIDYYLREHKNQY